MTSHPIKAVNQLHQLQLATLVLAGVLTKEQMRKIVVTNPALADTWEGIVQQVEEFKSSQALATYTGAVKKAKDGKLSTAIEKAKQ